jgi:hypothetical protein
MKSLNPTILVPESFGMPFEGGFYGGMIRSHADTKVIGIAWAPKALGERTGKLLPQHTGKIVAPSMCHSMDNTRALAEAGSELAQWALGLDINGYQDWCLPARDVLETGYRFFKPTTEANYLTFRDGDNPSLLPAG